MATYLKTAPIWICQQPGNWPEENLSPMSSGSGSSQSSDDQHHNTVVQLKKIRNVRKSDKHHCSICGDRPTGYHYDVLSCNGCKTFFRRTIINKRDFKCAKGGQCEFNKDFRCACRACRFNKCVLVGMNPSAIQFPTKYDDSHNDDFESEEDVKKMSICKFEKELLVDETFQTYQLVEEISRREDAVLAIRRRPENLPVEMDFSLTEVLRNPPVLGKNTQMPGELPGELYKNDRTRYWMVFDLYLNVEFAKTFDVFRELKEIDQKSLISHIGGLLHVATQSFYSYFEAKSDTLMFPDGTIAFQNKMDGIKTDAKRSVFINYYAEMYNLPIFDFLNLNMNMTEYSFFKSIALFSPNSLGMSLEGQIAVNQERERLMRLLRKYLIAERGFDTGYRRFSEILLAISTFITYGEKRRDYITLLRVMQFDVAKLGIDIYLKKPEEME